MYKLASGISNLLGVKPPKIERQADSEIWPGGILADFFSMNFYYIEVTKNHKRISLAICSRSNPRLTGLFTFV